MADIDFKNKIIDFYAECEFGHTARLCYTFSEFNKMVKDVRKAIKNKVERI